MSELYASGVGIRNISKRDALVDARVTRVKNLKGLLSAGEDTIAVNLVTKTGSKYVFYSNSIPDVEGYFGQNLAGLEAGVQGSYQAIIRGSDCIGVSGTRSVPKEKTIDEKVTELPREMDLNVQVEGNPLSVPSSLLSQFRASHEKYAIRVLSQVYLSALLADQGYTKSLCAEIEVQNNEGLFVARIAKGVLRSLDFTPK